MPAGMSMLCISLLAASTMSLNTAPGAATADTVMTRSRFLRSMVGGVMRSTT
ncbi:hypothetical protein Barb7_03196 [Bacteroidales bacterium Barb7]|nr:hypothetical protein Barb7_03196 [Bacteroidales bacterium Barb7]